MRSNVIKPALEIDSIGRIGGEIPTKLGNHVDKVIWRRGLLPKPKCCLELEQLRYMEKMSIQPRFYTTLSAHAELAKASGLALNTKPIPKM